MEEVWRREPEEAVEMWVEVDRDARGRARNDQLWAAAQEDLDAHIGSARETLAEADDDVDAVACIAVSLNAAQDVFSRSRLASVLAAALVRFAKEEGFGDELEEKKP